MRARIQEIRRGLFLGALRAADIGLIMVSFGLAALVSVDAAQWATLRSILASKVSLSSSALFALAVLVCYGVFSLLWAVPIETTFDKKRPEHRNPARNDICDCVPLVRGEIILNLGHDAEVFLRLLGNWIGIGHHSANAAQVCSKSDSETRPQSASPSSARHKCKGHWIRTQDRVDAGTGLSGFGVCR